jgi:kynurenine formamidase
LWGTVGEEVNFPTANGVVSNATNVVELPAFSGASTSVQETAMNKKAVVASRHHLWAHAAAITAVCLFTVTNLPAAAQSQTDLERAYRTISSKTFVDLTHSFGPDTPVWSGFGQAKFSPAADPKTHEPYTIPKDGFRTTYYEMVGQYGTHVDPPAHFAESGITMDKIPLKQMILPLVVLDDTPYLAKNPNHAFSVEDLKAWERQHGRVPKGAFAALRTDMYKDWDADRRRFERSPFPAWAFETIKFLYEQRGVTATGHESMDTDTTDKMDSETYILQHGHYQIEVMANLDKVPPTGSLIVVSWPKVRDGLGFPARAFAILP